MQFVLTEQGLAAAANAKGAGIRLVFGNFLVGSDFGYTPLNTQQGIKGTLLYTGQITNYADTSAGTLQFDLLMDTTVGDFSYGEIAIMLEDGITTFAIGTLPGLQQKFRQPSVYANQILETVQVNLASGVPLIQWVVNPITVGSIPEIASFDLVNPPDNSTSNTAIVHSPDDYGNHPMIYTQGTDTDLWEITTHEYQVYNDTVAAAVVGSNQFYGNQSPAFGTFPLGRYLIQFTSGASKGLIRQVLSVAGPAITMDTALGISTGDSFNIYQSTMSFIKAQALTFTPVQQGGGVGQLTDKVNIGWNGSALLATVDATHNLGAFVFETELAADVAALNAAIATKQPLGNYQINLGYTPVQQGGGARQQGDKVYIGWTGGNLACTVDSTDLGNFVFSNQLAAVAFSGRYSDLIGQPSNVWSAPAGFTSPSLQVDLLNQSATGVGQYTFVGNSAGFPNPATHGQLYALPGLPGTWMCMSLGPTGADGRDYMYMRYT